MQNKNAHRSTMGIKKLQVYKHYSFNIKFKFYMIVNKGNRRFHLQSKKIINNKTQSAIKYIVSLIRTLTVGFGFKPNQPKLNCSFKLVDLLEIIPHHHRWRISLRPETVVKFKSNMTQRI